MSITISIFVAGEGSLAEKIPVIRDTLQLTLREGSEVDEWTATTLGFYFLFAGKHPYEEDFGIPFARYGWCFTIWMEPVDYDADTHRNLAEHVFYRLHRHLKRPSMLVYDLHEKLAELP